MVLALTACSGTPPDLSVLESPMAAPPSALTTPADIDTLEEGIGYARALTEATPDLADEIEGTIDALDDLVDEADLPWETGNDVTQRLMRLNTDISRDPGRTVDHLAELHAIVEKLADAL
ncbi:hypothetical protein [Planctomonas psychrotolerans]|uniref:hypothetical protein n=1 Tax=Planctomonas psychrotolerans TaxID=2528712 RepID=UPI0012390472|nr:hypothetical protein [Planctomonas psychrotolerans]